ncbi:hypothetical protein CLPU_4c02340 [Gottschalkia purinilytica]|uniref:Uncharacterized protein n=1 Tax=Gottschalkia purinilytica TaxID=1503 RepID=A0A0L0WCJ4_GOTPU|nr:hypothetical protein [Gottschalkia purinilytica]KNF09188.1 hypothetical protein CLPU_4c02340 [Gottschalkia purinilytica]
MFNIFKDKDREIDLEYSILLKNRLPLLINDEIWISLFDDVEDSDIVNAKIELKSLINNEKEIKKELKDKKKEKKKVMAKILKLSDEINNNNLSDGVVLLEQAERDVHEINDYIDDLTFQLEEFPKQIREANLKILKATVKYAYSDLIDSQSKYESITKELDILREKLRDLIQKKFDYEEKINKTYTFLHNTLGSEEIDKLDKDILDSKNA